LKKRSATERLPVATIRMNEPGTAFHHTSSGPLDSCENRRGDFYGRVMAFMEPKKSSSIYFLGAT